VVPSRASDDCLAAALHINIDHTRRKRRLLDGISPDAPEPVVRGEDKFGDGGQSIVVPLRWSAFT
jgi:hypothetical protein